uniref:hypothetical protein n=1 Tax=Haramonas pauciplastida TaxID=478668 RepID=UPI0021143191|nr:hypothetical protein NQY21_pgp171 [Haramonas pauciplastida]UTE94914.1 hypothetical protein HaraPt_p003 [Haramonas pauciplastida]
MLNLRFKTLLLLLDLRETKKLYFLIQKNKYEVYFRVYKYSDIYWDGRKIDFSGNNAAQVYDLIQEQNLDWNIFQLFNLSLSRFDLCYFREIKSSEKLKGFINNIIAKIDNKYKRNILIMTKVQKVIFYKLAIEKVQTFPPFIKQKMV